MFFFIRCIMLLYWNHHLIFSHRLTVSFSFFIQFISFSFHLDIRTFNTNTLPHIIPYVFVPLHTNFIVLFSLLLNLFCGILISLFSYLLLLKLIIYSRLSIGQGFYILIGQKESELRERKMYYVAYNVCAASKRLGKNT